jgi:two-component system, NtrC family, C4-dicarboxylate transport sensor histidine kinase DctB
MGMFPIVANRKTMLTLSAALLALLGAMLVSDYFAVRRAVEAEHDRLTNVARLTASSFQRQVDKFRLVATTLAADSDVERLLDTRASGSAARLNKRLADLSATLDASVIYLIDAGGTTIASSNWRQADSFLNENYAFRAYFAQALARGEWEQYALGTRSRIPGLFVARRVITDADTKGVIVVKIRFDRLEREWAVAAGTAFVASEQGVILVSSKPSWRFETIRPLDAAEQRHLGAQVEFGNAPLRQNDAFATGAVVGEVDDLNRRSKYVASRESLPNGWSVYVLGPLNAAAGSARNFARLVVLVVAGFIITLAVFYALRRRAIIAGEQRENAARLADLKERLVQANKLSSLGQMAAGIGHEINQPLTAIGIRTRNAQKMIENGRISDAATALGEIGALTTRIGAITGELRRFARRGDGRVGKVSIQAILDGVRLLMGDRIRTTRTTVTIGPQDAQVMGDQGRLEQVFVNLFQNALDAIGDGGEIGIDIAVSGQTASISVCDTGPGVDPSIRPRLFQPFSTSKDDGLGLGLVICRDIIAGFGGELQLAESARGATFIVTLRIAP